MPYIYHNKKLDQYRLFGSLPVMCKNCGLDYNQMQYSFRDKKTQYENDNFKVVKLDLERGKKK